MRHLLVISKHEWQVHEWALDNDLPSPRRSRAVYAVTPWTNGDRLRGLSEYHTAIVWLDDVPLPERTNRVLEVYVRMHCALFEPAQVDEIRAWLTHCDLRPDVQARALGQDGPPPDLDHRDERDDAD